MPKLIYVADDEKNICFLIQNFLEKEGLQEFDTTFLSDVSTTLFVEESEIERLGQELTEFYQGKVTYEKSGKKIVEIPI